MTAGVLLFLFCFAGVGRCWRESENCVKKFVKIQKLDMTNNSNTVQDKAGELYNQLSYFKGQRSAKRFFKRLKFCRNWRILHRLNFFPLAFRHWKALIDKKPETWWKESWIYCFLRVQKMWRLKKPNGQFMLGNPESSWTLAKNLKTVPWIFAGNSEAFDTNHWKGDIEETYGVWRVFLRLPNGTLEFSPVILRLLTRIFEKKTLKRHTVFGEFS